jgi:hypothetical protein
VFSKKLVGMVILSLGAATAAQAYDSHGGEAKFAPKWFYGVNHKYPQKPMVAPEIDPATALSGFTMLAGGLAVIRGRRARK